MADPALGRVPGSGSLVGLTCRPRTLPVYRKTGRLVPVGGVGKREKHRTLWPVPGGRGKFLKTLKLFLGLAEGDPSVDSFVTQIVRRCRGVSSRKAAMSYMRVPINLGLLSIWRGQVSLTDDGQDFLSSGDVQIVRDALFEQIAGVSELYQIVVKHPARLGILTEYLRAEGYVWAGASQVRYRLHWLAEVGVLGTRGGGRPEYFALMTPAGTRL